MSRFSKYEGLRPLAIIQKNICVRKRDYRGTTSRPAISPYQATNKMRGAPMQKICPTIAKTIAVFATPINCKSGA